MSGPNLSLGVSVAGLEQLNALRTAIAATKAELASLSTAGTSLQGLQRAAQMAGSVGDDFSALRGDVQKLAGSFDSLAGSIKTSLAAISTAAAESTAGVTKQLKRQEDQAQKTAANIVANAKFAAMATRAQARTIISARSQLDFGIDEAAVAKRFGDSAVAAAKMAESLQTLKEAHYQSAAATKQSGQGMSVFSKQANDAVAAVEKISRAQAAVTNKTIKGAAGSEAQTRLMLGTNLSDQGALTGMKSYYAGLVSANKAGAARLEAEYQKSIAALEKNVSGVMQAATRTGYQPADRAWWDKVLANQEKAQAKLDAAYAASVGQLEKQVGRIMKAATAPGYLAAGPAWWEKVIADQEKATAKLDAEYQKSVARLETQVSKVMKAATKPAYLAAGRTWWEKTLADQEAGIAKLQASNARFAALNDRGQARATIRARAGLDSGLSEAVLTAQLGETAVAAAKAATSLEALKKAHYGAAVAGGAHSGALSVFAKNANDAHSAARGLASGFNAMWLTWGNLAPLLAGAALSNAVVQTGKVGSQVSYQLEFVKQLNDESSATIQAVREQIRALSKDSLFTLDESTKGLTALVQAGLSAAEAMQVLPHVMNLATVGEMDLKSAGEGLIGIMNAFGIPMEKAAATADKFGKAQQLAQVGVQDYIEAMKYASTVAGQYNQDLDNSFAAITLLGKINIKGTAAGTSYRNFLKDLYDPSVKAKRAMDELGVASFDAAGKQREFIAVMQDLKTATDPLTEESRLKALGQIFSERGGKTAVALLSDMTGEYGKLGEAIKNSEGYNQRVADALQKQVGPSFKQAFNAMRASMDEVFQSYESNYANVAASLKTAFSSNEFKTSLAGLISIVGSLTTFIIEHHRAILLVIEAYIAWKGASLVIDIIQGVGKAMIFATMNARLMASSMLAGQGAMAAMTGAGAATSLAQMGQSAAVAAGGLAGTAAQVGTLAARMPMLAAILGALLNPITAVIAALGLMGYAFYQMYEVSSDASSKLVDSVVRDNKLVIGSIDKVIAKERERQSMVAQGSQPYEKELSDIESLYSAEKSRFEQSRTEAARLRQQGKTAQAALFDASAGDSFARMFELNQGRGKLIASRSDLDREREARQLESQRKAEAKAKAAAAVGGTETFDGSAPKSSRGAYRLDNAEISAVERAYKDQEKLLTEHFSQQRALIDAQKKYRLANEVEAATSLEMLTRANFAQLEKLDAQHLSDTKDELAKARDEAGKVRAQSMVDAASATAKQHAQEKKRWEDQVAIERAGQLNLVKVQTQDFIEKASLEQEDFRQRIARELELSQLDAVTAAGRAARYDAEVKYNKEIIRQKVEIADLDRALARADYDSAGAIIEQIKAREAAIAQLQAAKTASADLAEQTARSAEETKRSWDYGMTQAVRDYADSLTDAAKRARGFGETMQQVFGDAGGAVAKLTIAMAGYGKARDDIAATKQLDIKAAGNDPVKLVAAESKARDASAKAAVGHYANMASAAKGFFNQNSKGYKALEGVEKGFRAAQLAMDLASMTKKLFITETVTAAVVGGRAAETQATLASVGPEIAASAAKGQAAAAVGVANQAQGDPYSAWPRMAAMAALMAALGFAVAGSMSGSSPDIAAERQSAAGTGTILGDSTAKSTSIANALSSLTDSAKIELSYQSGMLAALRSIEANIKGLANLVVRVPGLSGKVTDAQSSMLGVGFQQDIHGKLAEFGAHPSKFLDGIIGKLPGGDILTGIAGKIASFVGGLFGTKTSIRDQGIYAGPQTIANIRQSGFDAQSYVDLERKRKAFGFTISSSYSTAFGELPQELKSQFGQIVGNIVQGAESAVGALGVSSDQFFARVDNFVVSLGKISLKDLTGTQIQEQLENIFGALGDSIARVAMPSLDAFQRVGEGYFETLIRVANGVEQARYALSQFGVAVISYTEVVNKQGDVGAEIIRDSVLRMERFADGSLTGVGRIIEGVTGTVDDLVGTYSTLMDLRKAMKAVGTDARLLSAEMMRGAGGADKLQSGLDAYFENFFSETEKAAARTRWLTTEFQRIGLAGMPASEAGFRRIVDAIDTSTESGQVFYGQMMALAGAFHDATSAASDFLKQVKEFQDSLLGGDLSTLSPEQKYLEAKKQYDATSVAAAAGDATARDNWTNIAQAFLEASRAYYASSSQYAIDFAKVQGYRVDGSHASGLDYVPEDGYIAELHRGEAVLTASDAARYRASSGGASSQTDSEVTKELRALRRTIEAQHQQAMRVEAAKAKGSVDAREEAKEGNKQLVKTMRQVMEQL
ncbi:phage tail tape measure protein [Cupriavidus basilensis]|uniref:phage tail tape measure protein n=1 Tax=Cupriavidus basilensis TaxID=68895 RepID=UPI0020A667C9|nr:phage tail tape measure protein [Cupriavidus basilensis]MCP3023261.1 phage tail tape measure protein [Cupriavidus basilensis]